MTVEACVCELAGWCERHGRKKTERLFRLCQTSEAYRQNWDRHAKRQLGDTQPKVARPQRQCEKKSVRGVGTYLRAILKRLGYKSKGACKCSERAREMNKNGIQWCKDNVDTIVGWLKEEAERQKVVFFERGARLIVWRAIAMADKRQKP